MPADITVRVEGLRELSRALSKMEGFDKELPGIHKRVAGLVSGEAMTRVPRLSGALAASIKATGTKQSAIIKAGSTRVPYARVIHYGWPGRFAGQPFLTGALAAEEPQVVAEYDRSLVALLRKAFASFR